MWAEDQSGGAHIAKKSQLEPRNPTVDDAYSDGDGQPREFPCHAGKALGVHSVEVGRHSLGGTLRKNSAAATIAKTMTRGQHRLNERGSLPLCLG